MSTIKHIPRWQTAIHSLSEGKMPLTKLTELVFKNGPSIGLHAGGVIPMILTADPDFIQHILLKNRKNYSKSSRNFDCISHFAGRGLFTSEGAYWLKQRRLIQPGFHKNRLKAVLAIIDEVTDQFLEGLDTSLQQDSTVDIYEQMQEVTLSVIAHTIFSSNLKEQEFQRLSDNLSRLQSFIIRMIRQPYLYWWLKLSGQIKAHEALRDECNAIFKKYIEQRRASGEEQDDLLQMLLDVRYEDTGEGMTTEQLLDEINILFIAGHETTASALSWTWYLLSQHPAAMEKVRAEVNQVVTGGEIDFAQINQLEYTQQVLEEAIRLYPPSWATNRVAVEDDEFKGIRIKKGTVMATYFYAVHRSPDIWENPEAFQPERFSKAKKKARHPYAFVPFGGGPRMCIGKQFGLMEMKLIVAKMVQRYEMKLLPNQHIEPSPSLILKPEQAINMELLERKDSPQEVENASNKNDMPCPHAIPGGAGNQDVLAASCPFMRQMQGG